MADEERIVENWERELNEDGTRRFQTYQEYERYYVQLVDKLYEASRKEFKPIKARWMEADKRLELDRMFALNTGTSTATRTDIALVPQAVEKRISLLIENLPRPQISPRQAGQEDLVGALNYFVNEVLDQNRFDLTIGKVALDMSRFNIGILKVTISEHGTGPFGLPGKIEITKTDPRYVWPDPYAKSWRWSDMKYLIVAEPEDIADIRLRYGRIGKRVKPDLYSSRNENSLDQDLTFPSMLESTSGFGSSLGERDRVLVKECWLKDYSMMEVPKEDDDGNPILGEDGEPVMCEVMRYPRGRLIITANGVILQDGHNPFQHPCPPYAFFLNRLSTRMFSYGDIELLARLEDKINTIHKDCLRNARVNINAPWLVDNGAFDSPEMYDALTNEEGLIIIKSPNSTVQRLTPAELPQFVFPLMSWLTGIFNDLSGVSNIMQGQLEKGAQLSATAISDLQGAASANLRLKGRLFETGLEELGYLLSFDVRDVYRSDQVFTLIDPKDGKKKEINWTPKELEGEYPVEVSAGSSLPGAKAGAQSQAITLFDHDLIDRQAALDQMQYPNRGPLIDRMNQREEKLASLGVQAKLRQSKTGRAGRKGGSYNV